MAPRVFMLEDDLAIVKMVRAVMQKDGFEFEAAHKSAEALEALKRHSPDVVLLDVELPDGDGYSVCEAIRRDPQLCGVPVIFLTGKGDVESRLKGFAAGSQDYVPKPFALEELRARIRAHLAVKERLDRASAKAPNPDIQDRVRQDLADMVLHDLRAPIGTIKITLSLLRDSGLIASTDYDLLLQNAQSAADVVLFMANDLVDVSKGELKVEPVPCELAKLVEKLRSLFAPQLELRKLRLDAWVDPALPQVQLDPMLALRVLANVVSNAVKFSEPGAAVELRASRDGGMLRFEVRDHGPGVPEAEKPKIFQMRYRADTPQTRATAGSGVGLAFCLKACQSCGGRIRVEDAQDGGSRFIVELPFVPA